MAAPSHRGEDPAHIHFRDAASADDIDPVIHAKKGEDRVQVLHVAEFLDERGQVAHVVLGAALGDHDVYAVDVVHRLPPL